jgi:Hint domain
MVATTKTSETFNFTYALTKSAGVYTLVDANPGSPGVNPVAVGVTAVDQDGGSVAHDDKIKISDVASGALSDGNKYTYIGTAEVPGLKGITLDGIVVKDNQGDFFFLTDTAYNSNLNGHHGQLTVNTSAESTFCFMTGTMIRTPDGEVPVETLKRGDLVLTSDGRSVPVDWLGIQTVSLMFADKMRVLPIRIRAGALAENGPSRDLLVSPDHALLVDGALIQAGALVNGTSITRETNVPSTFIYYHVEVDDHSLILAENTPAETFVDNVDRLGFDNWAEHEALYPNGKLITELPYPRAKSHRQVPVSTRVMLAARAEAIGAVAAAVA